METGDAVFACGRDVAGGLPGPFGLVTIVSGAVLPYYARDAVIHETCGHAFDAGDDFLPTVFVEDLFVVRTPVGISGDVECEGVRGIAVDFGYEVAVYAVLRQPEALQSRCIVRSRVCVHDEETACVAASRGAHGIHEILVIAVRPGVCRGRRSVPTAGVEQFVVSLEEQARTIVAEAGGNLGPKLAEPVPHRLIHRFGSEQPAAGTGVVVDVENAVQAGVQHVADDLLHPCHPVLAHVARGIHMLEPGHRHPDGAESGIRKGPDKRRGGHGLSPGGLICCRGAVRIKRDPVAETVQRIAEVPADLHLFHDSEGAPVRNPCQLGGFEDTDPMAVDKHGGANLPGLVKLVRRHVEGDFPVFQFIRPVDGAAGKEIPVDVYLVFERPVFHSPGGHVIHLECAAASFRRDGIAGLKSLRKDRRKHFLAAGGKDARTQQEQRDQPIHTCDTSARRSRSRPAGEVSSSQRPPARDSLSSPHPCRGRFRCW